MSITYSKNFLSPFSYGLLKLKLCISIIVLLTTFNPALGQWKVEELRETVFSKDTPISDRASAMLSLGLAYHYRFSDKEDSAYYFLSEAKKSILDNELESLYFKMLLIHGAFYSESNQDSAFYYAKAALNNAESRKDTVEISVAANFLGGQYTLANDFVVAQQYLTLGLKFAEMSGISSRIATCLSNLSTNLNEMNNPKSASEYILKSVKLYANDSTLPRGGYANSLNNLISIYIQLNELNLAEKYISEASRTNEKWGTISSQNLFYRLKASLFHKKDEFLDSAIYYNNLAVKGQKDNGDYSDLGLTYSNLSDLYLDRNIEKAYAMIDSSFQYLSYATRAAQVKIIRKKIEVLFELEDLGEVSALFEQYSALKDSVFSLEKQRSVDQVTAEYELDKREQENEKLSQQAKLKDVQILQQTTQRNALLIGLGLLSFFSILIYRSQRQKTRLNQQLREAEEIKTRWFVNVSHELKTPLTLVQGPMSQLMESESLNETDRKRLKLANRNLRNLQGLVTEILDLSRHEKGQLELLKTPTNLSEMVKSTVASFESLAKVNKVRLEAQVLEDFWLELDAGKVRKLVENLVSNALKFTHEGGSIEARIVRIAEAVQVIVKDTGEGISEEDLPYVFDRFYQSKEKSKSRQGGTGVGLSLAKEVAELHGGTLTVTSRLGEGSAFVLSLPNELLTNPAESSDLEVEDMVEAPIDDKYTSRLRVKPSLLLVEDNADMRTYIEDVLKKEYSLTMARDGKDALDKLRTNSFDLIISDVMMPRMDGLELVGKIKEHKDWSQLPIIMLTALNTDEDRIHALRTGIDDYLGKPFNPEELKVRASNLLANSNQRNEDEEETDSFDDQLLRMLEEEVTAHLTDSLLSVSYLAEKANMSERSLRRYLKKTTGLSPLDFILELKLQKAMTLLEQKTYPTLKEVANATGFDRSARLTSAFEKRFGKKPADYLS